MSEQPTVGLPPTEAGDAPTRDPAALAPTLATAEPTRALADTAAGSSGLPDMSMGAGGDGSAGRATAEPPKLDGYQVLNPIGEGGMGTVWRGVQLSTRRNVALKLMSAAAFGSERARQRFDREVEITARLEHPHIARVYDSGINRGVYFYAMELIDGCPLDQFVAQRHLSRPQVLRLFATVCRAVDHAHKAGVIHRDLKPTNILVSPDGQPHVLDFGLAKALMQAGKEAGISVDGEVAGTPGYMSPEQAAGRGDLDQRSDVYALGVILYRLLTGCPPHALSGNYLDVMRRISEEEPRRPRAADPSMDRELEALLIRALQRDARQRYASAGELAQDIENYLAGDPIAARAPTAVYFLRKRATKHRTKLAVLTVGLVLIVLASGLTVGLTRTRRLAHDAAVQKTIADARKHVTEGDVALAAGDGAAARGHYTAAVGLFRSAGASTLSADLGLWDAARLAPEPLITFGHAAEGTGVVDDALAFLPVGRRALAGCYDGSLRLWDVAAGQLIRTIPAHAGRVTSVAVAGDGWTALTGGADRTLKVWDLANASTLVEIKAVPGTDDADGTGVIKRVAISRDGRTVACAAGLPAGDHDIVTIWNISPTAPPLLLHRIDPTGSVTRLQFAPDGSTLLAAGSSVAIWRMTDAAPLMTTRLAVTTVAFSRDGQLIACGGSDGAVRLVDLQGNVLATFNGRDSAVRAVWLDATNGTRIRVATEDGALRSFDAAGRESWSRPAGGDLTAASFSPDGAVALTASDADGLAAWMTDPPEAGRVGDAGNGGAFADAMLSADGAVAASRESRRRGEWSDANVWETANTSRVAPLVLASGKWDGVVLCRTGGGFAAITGSGAAIWSLGPAREVKTFALTPLRPSDASPVAAISPDGATLVVLAADGRLLLCRRDEALPSQGPAAIVRAPDEKPITRLALSPDGRRLLTGHEDGAVRLRDLTGGSLPVVLGMHAAPVNALAFADDGATAASASGAAKYQRQAADDDSVRLWSVNDAKLLRVLRGHTARVRAVAISGDGALVASGADDENVIVWNAASGEIVRTLRGPGGPVLALSFDGAGRSLIVGANALCLWEFDTTRAARATELRSAMQAARERAGAGSLDSEGRRAMGNWYTFRGEMDWAWQLTDVTSATAQEKKDVK